MFNTITQEALWMPDYNKRLLEQNKEKQPEPPTSPSQSDIRRFREYKKWREAFDPAVRAVREAEKKVEDIMYDFYLENTFAHMRIQDALAHAQAQLANDKELKPNPKFVEAFQK